MTIYKIYFIIQLYMDKLLTNIKILYNRIDTLERLIDIFDTEEKVLKFGEFKVDYINAQKSDVAFNKNLYDIINGIKTWLPVPRLLDYKAILNEFTFKKILGQGSFGTVLLVTRKSDNKDFVLKIQDILTTTLEHIPNEYIPDYLKDVQIEINALRRASASSCDDIVKLYDIIYDETTNQIVYVMEFIEGYDLTKIINEIKEIDVDKYVEKFKIYWKEKDFIDNVVNPIIRGLRCLNNNGMAHRDIKPSNIMYNKIKKKTKLIDLGITCIDKCPNTLVGTIIYGAPELFNNSLLDLTDLNVWKKADIWSLGKTLYEITIGQEYPWSDDTFLSLTDSELLNTMGTIIPKEYKCIAKLIRGFLVIDPNERWNNWLTLTTYNGINPITCL